MINFEFKLAYPSMISYMNNSAALVNIIFFISDFIIKL